MAVPTPSEMIPIAQISQYLSAVAINNGGLNGGGHDVTLPQKIRNIRKNLEWMYNLSPSNSSLNQVSQYLYSLCAPFNAKAQVIINHANGGGGTPILNPGGGQYEYTNLVVTFGSESTDINDTAFFTRTVLVDGLMVNTMSVNGQIKTLPTDFTFDAPAGEINYGANHFFTGDIITIPFLRKIS